MLQKVAIVLLFVTGLLSLGCSGSDESLTVAKNFWKAMEDRDLEAARSYATRATANSLNLGESGEDQAAEIIFGEVSREDGKTLVATTLKTAQDDHEINIPLKTVLVKEDGKWKVDVDQTMMSLFGGAMGAMMDSMKEGFEEMGKAVADEMKAGFEEAGEEVSNSENEE